MKMAGWGQVESRAKIVKTPVKCQFCQICYRFCFTFLLQLFVLILNFSISSVRNIGN